MKALDLQYEFKHYALAEKGMRRKTFVEIVNLIRRVTEFSGSQELDHRTESAVRGFLQHGMLEKGWEPKTFHVYWQYLKIFFDWCEKRNYILENPTKNIEKPRLKKPLQRFLTRDDARKILYHASFYPWRYAFEKARNLAIVATFLQTGLRLNELINLEMRNVDLREKLIFVREGKGSKDRLVPIHRQLDPILRQYLKEVEREKRDDPWFFKSMQRGKKISVKAIRRFFSKISQASGVKFTPHMLRHTFGREMTDKDFPLFKLKAILGHSSILTTQRYQSVSHESVKASFDGMQLY